MIIRSIRIADWRCVLNAVEVGPFSEGLNIIHAPNATGKSTLFEAFRRALLDGHKVTGRDVEAIRPWGRELSPKVSVEFEHQGRGYRITKQFLDNQTALLERKETGKYQRLAEGVAADDITREMFTKNPPGRGLCRSEHWGIAQVLWAPQGNLTFDTVSDDLIANIRGMLSAQVSGTGSGPLEKLIESRYLDVFSSKGKLKSGKDAPELVCHKNSLMEAIKIRQKALEQYRAFEDASRRVEEFQARRMQARRDADAFSKTLREANEIAESYRLLLSEKAQRAEKMLAAEAQYKEITLRVKAMKSIESELADASKALETLEDAIPLKEREEQEREQETVKLKAVLEDTRSGRVKVDSAKRLADLARRFNECRRDLARLDELIEKVKDAEQTLANWRQTRNAFVAPDSKLLRAARKTIKDRDDAQLLIDASLITLEIVSKNDSAIEVLVGEVIGKLALKPNVPLKIKGSPEIVVDIPEVARFRARAPVNSIEEYREARAKATRKLNELLEPYGTEDIDTLESMIDKAKDLDTSVAQVAMKVQTLLSGKSLDELIQNRGTLVTILSGFLDAQPDWAKNAPDSHALETEADQTERAFIEAVEEAEGLWMKAQVAYTAVSGHKEALTRQLEDSRHQIQNLNAKFAELTNDGITHQERESNLRRITMGWEAACARLQEINTQLETFGEDPSAVVDRLEAQCDAANQFSNQVREQVVKEEAILETLCAQGSYSALSTSEEKIVQLERDIKREEIQVEAIRLLRDTVVECRAEAIASVSGPVEAAATRTLQRITGHRLGNVKINEGFVPSAVMPESIDQAVYLDNLSGGEQEQLYLATRLALADVLGRDERQLVVFDDVLTATDSGRLARVMNILEEAAQRLQILILTCHPERYRGLKHGTFHDLEELIREGRPG